MTRGDEQNMEIVVTGSVPFSTEQVRRLQRVGRLTLAGNANSSDEWLKQVLGADIVCSDGMFVAENLERLHDVFITFPFVVAVAAGGVAVMEDDLVPEEFGGVAIGLVAGVDITGKFA